MGGPRGKEGKQGPSITLSPMGLSGVLTLPGLLGILFLGQLGLQNWRTKEDMENREAEETY